MSIVSPVVWPLSGTIAASYTADGYVYDYALGGLPFLSAIGHASGQFANSAYVRETAPYRKEQFDASKDPGEQSLVFWWLKSQSSFHGGAGQQYLDTALNSDDLQSVKFMDSLGVDVWTPGQVTLLRSCDHDLTKTATSQRLMGAYDGTTPVYFLASDAVLTRSTGAATAAVTWGGADIIKSLCNDGSNYYAADTTGIYKGTLAGGAGALAWNTGGTPCIAWVKQRLMAGIGPSIYELVGAGPGLPTAKYTHPNPNWVWTAIAQGPSAVYAAGYAGSTSEIYKFTLDSAGVVPTLTSGVTVCEMPPGEQIRSLFPYLGSLLAIGTSKGVRIAVFEDGAGNFTYGPRVFDTTLPVRSIVGDDKFLYVGVSNGLDGDSGLYRVNVNEPTLGAYAYASDLQAKVTGEVAGVCLLGSRLAFAVEGSGSYLQSATAYEPSGTLTTSRIRFGTVEPKLLKYVRLRAAALVGELQVDLIEPDGDITTLAHYTEAGAATLEEAAISASSLEYASLTLTLTANGAGTGTPEFRSYQIKALPAAKRQRLETLVMLCYDEERDRSGQQMGAYGTARTRLQALEELEETGDVIPFQHFSADAGITTRLVVIDQLRFTQREPPSNINGWGGVIEAVLRSVD